MSAPSAVTVRLAGMRLASTLNAREHWGDRRRRERAQLRQLLDALGGVPLPAGPPWRVTVVRVGPRKLDSDNLTASAKHLRDALARWLGVDDGDEGRVRFEVEQARGPYAVRVEVRSC